MSTNLKSIGMMEMLLFVLWEKRENLNLTKESDRHTGGIFLILAGIIF